MPITGLDWRIVTSAGQGAEDAAAGRAASRIRRARSSRRRTSPRDPENGQSVGSLITLGQFRAIDLGDLLWNNELDLMCPNNPIGTIDLYLVSHHGTDPSGSAALVHGAAAARRGDAERHAQGRRRSQAMQTMRIVAGSRGHLAAALVVHGAGIEQNSAGVFIANVEDAATTAAALTAPQRAAAADVAVVPPLGAPPVVDTPGAGAPPAGNPPPGAVPPPGAPPAGAAPSGRPPTAGPPGGGQGGGRGAPLPPHTPAYWIKITAQPDGSFTVSNSRNGFSKTYAARPRAR